MMRETGSRTGKELYTVCKSKSKIFEGKWLIVKPNGDTLGLLNSLVDCGIVLDFFDIDYEVKDFKNIKINKMKLLHLTASQARSYWGSKPMIRQWYVYRLLTNGSYKLVGSIYWDCNYAAIPLKDKYHTRLFLSTVNGGEIVR